LKSNLLETVHKIIYLVFYKGGYSSELLVKYAPSSHEVGLLYFLVKGVIKYQINLEFIAKKYAQKLDDKTRVVVYIGLYSLKYANALPDYVVVKNSVDLAKKILSKKKSGFVNALLRNFCRDNKETLYPKKNYLALKYSYPSELVAMWVGYWGEVKTEKLCKYFNEPSKISLRCRNSKDVFEYFRAKNTEIQKSSLSNEILLTSDKSVLRDDMFVKGMYTVQDASASLVVDLLRPEKNDIILDAFAAPGGKTTHIAQKLQNTGKVIAVDLQEKKIEKIVENLRRLKLNNVTTVCKNIFNFESKTKFDKIILDVPCSGLGVLGKKAELRYGLNHSKKQLIKLQKKALLHCQKFLRVGGVLVYSTCTLDKAENEHIIKYFLQKNAEFKLVEASEYLDSKVCENGFLKVLPFEHRCDGAFGARLKKVKCGDL